MDLTAELTTAPRCPVCGTEPRAVRIHDEIVVECSNPDCHGPDSEDGIAQHTIDGALTQWSLFATRCPEAA